jgi:hypothetical protein
MTQIQWVYRCMIVPAATVAQTRGLADKFGPAAQNMWITELSPTGAAPATHYISAGLIDPLFASMFASPEALQAGALQAGITVDLATCAALLSAATVTDGTFTSTGLDGKPMTATEGPLETIARLGLQLVQRPL